MDSNQFWETFTSTEPLRQPRWRVPQMNTAPAPVTAERYVQLMSDGVDAHGLDVVARNLNNKPDTSYEAWVNDMATALWEASVEFLQTLPVHRPAQLVELLPRHLRQRFFPGQVRLDEREAWWGHQMDTHRAAKHAPQEGSLHSSAA